MAATVLPNQPRLHHNAIIDCAPNHQEVVAALSHGHPLSRRNLLPNTHEHYELKTELCFEVLTDSSLQQMRSRLWTKQARHEHECTRMAR